MTNLYIPSGYSVEAIKKQVYIFGGGGEPDGDKTIFDNSLKHFSNFLNSSDWSSTLSFNGGHKETEKIIKSNYVNANNLGRFNEDNYNKAILEMIEKIESGQLKSGDQLMVVVDTHGSRKKNERTHSVASSEIKATFSLREKIMLSLDKLEDLTILASSKGIKLAILDFSCFSGNLLNIKNDKVCLISATGPDQYAYTGSSNFILFNHLIMSKPDGFTSQFIASLKAGQNLEDLFLNARLGDDIPDFPMISTNEGRFVNEVIYNLLTPYLIFNGKMDNGSIVFDFTNAYSSEANIESHICSLNNNFELFQKVLNQFEKVDGIVNLLVENEFTELKESLSKYRDYQKSYEKLLVDKLKIEDEIKNILVQDFSSEEERWKDYDPYTFVDLNARDTINSIEAKKKLEGDKFSGEMAKVLEELKAKQRLSDAIKNKLSISSKKSLDEYAKLINNPTEKLARDVSVAAKKVYISLYKSMMNNTTPNPCREFKL
jgi:hypothetical protein